MLILWLFALDCSLSSLPTPHKLDLDVHMEGGVPAEQGYTKFSVTQERDLTTDGLISHYHVEADRSDTNNQVEAVTSIEDILVNKVVDISNHNEASSGSVHSLSASRVDLVHLGELFSSRAEEVVNKHQTDLSRSVDLAQEIGALSVSSLSIKDELLRYDAEQELCVSREDFDSAESLEEVISKLRADAFRNDQTLVALRSEYDRLDASIRNYPSVCKRVIQEASVALRNLQVRESDLLREVTREVEDRSDKIEHWRARPEIERVQAEKLSIGREEERLEEEALQIETSIREQCGELHAKHEQHRTSLIVLEMEIEELERELRLKKDQRQALSVTVDAMAKEIGEVRSKYSRQLARISDRLAAVGSARRDCEAEESAILEERQALELQREALGQSEADHRRNIMRIAVSISLLESVAAQWVVSSDAATEIRSTEEDVASDLRSQLSVLDQAVEAGADQLRHTRRRVDAIMNELKSASEKASLLENEKREHAAAKRFKEAAALAKAAKEVAQRTEDLSTELGELRGLVEQLQQSSSVAEGERNDVRRRLSQLDLLAANAELARLERDLAIAREIISLVDDAKPEIDSDLLLSMRRILSTQVSTLSMRKARLENECKSLSGPILEGDERVDPQLDPPLGIEEQRRELYEQKRLMRRLSADIERASAAEDYETAAALDEQLTALSAAFKLSLGSLGLASEDLD